MYFFFLFLIFLCPICVVVHSSALMECLVLPLHDKLEEWKKMVVNLDKEHSKGERTTLLSWTVSDWFGQQNHKKADKIFLFLKKENQGKYPTDDVDVGVLSLSIVSFMSLLRTM